MKKGELVGVIAKKNEVPATEATWMLDAVFAAIEDALAHGEEVNVTGFGKFSVSERAAREGRNPQTGEPISIAASRVVGFKAGAPLKEAVSGR